MLEMKSTASIWCVVVLVLLSSTGCFAASDIKQNTKPRYSAAFSVSGSMLGAADMLSAATSNATSRPRHTNAPSTGAQVGSENWNVQCSNGGRCSDTYPICCGNEMSSNMYCVSAGDKCCQSPTNSKKYSSCAPYETCCASDADVECCGYAETCNTASEGPNSCEPDYCTFYADVPTCTNVPSCGWNCYHQKCQLLNLTFNSGSLLTQPHQRCDDPCTYATTCDRCGAAKDANGNGCAWCCQSQSCASVNNTVCGVQEVIQTQTTHFADGSSYEGDFKKDCPKCNFGGKGLHVSNDPEVLGYQMMLMAVIGMALTLCIACIMRYALFRRQRAMEAQIAAMEALESRVARDPQHTVKKFGFKKKKKKDANGDDERERSRSAMDTELSPPNSDSDSTSLDEDAQRAVDEQNPFLKELFAGQDDASPTTADREAEEDEGEQKPAAPHALLLPCGHPYTPPLGDGEEEVPKPKTCPVCGERVDTLFVPGKVIR